MFILKDLFKFGSNSKMNYNESYQSQKENKGNKFKKWLSPKTTCNKNACDETSKLKHMDGKLSATAKMKNKHKTDKETLNGESVSLKNLDFNDLEKVFYEENYCMNCNVFGSPEKKSTEKKCSKNKSLRKVSHNFRKRNKEPSTSTISSRDYSSSEDAEVESITCTGSCLQSSENSSTAVIMYPGKVPQDLTCEKNNKKSKEMIRRSSPPDPERTAYKKHKTSPQKIYYENNKKTRKDVIHMNKDDLYKQSVMEYNNKILLSSKEVIVIKHPNSTKKTKNDTKILYSSKNNEHQHLATSYKKSKLKFQRKQKGKFVYSQTSTSNYSENSVKMNNKKRKMYLKSSIRNLSVARSKRNKDSKAEFAAEKEIERSRIKNKCIDDLLIYEDVELNHKISNKKHLKENNYSNKHMEITPRDVVKINCMTQKHEQKDSEKTDVIENHITEETSTNTFVKNIPLKFEYERNNYKINDEKNSSQKLSSDFEQNNVQILLEGENYKKEFSHEKYNNVTANNLCNSENNSKISRLDVSNEKKRTDRVISNSSKNITTYACYGSCKNRYQPRTNRVDETRKERNLKLFKILEEMIGERKIKRSKPKYCNHVSTVSLVITKKERNAYKEIHKNILKKYRASTTSGATYSKNSNSGKNKIKNQILRNEAVIKNKETIMKNDEKNLVISVLPGIQILPVQEKNITKDISNTTNNSKFKKHTSGKKNVSIKSKFNKMKELKKFTKEDKFVNLSNSEGNKVDNSDKIIKSNDALKKSSLIVLTLNESNETLNYLSNKVKESINSSINIYDANEISISNKNEENNKNTLKFNSPINQEETKVVFPTKILIQSEKNESKLALSAPAPTTPSRDTLFMNATDSEIWDSNEKGDKNTKSKETRSERNEEIKKLECSLQKSIGKDLKNCSKSLEKSSSSNPDGFFNTTETQKYIEELENLVKQKAIEQLRKNVSSFCVKADKKSDVITNNPIVNDELNNEKEKNDFHASDIKPDELSDENNLPKMNKLSQNTQQDAENKNQKNKKRSNLNVVPLETVFESEEQPQPIDVIEVELFKTSNSCTKMRIVNNNENNPIVCTKNMTKIKDVNLKSLNDFEDIEKQIKKLLDSCSLNLLISVDNKNQEINLEKQPEIDRKIAVNEGDISETKQEPELSEELNEEFIDTYVFDVGYNSKNCNTQNSKEIKAFPENTIDKNIETIKSLSTLLDVTLNKDNENYSQSSNIIQNTRKSLINHINNAMEIVNICQKETFNVEIKPTYSYRKGMSRLPVYVGMQKDRKGNNIDTNICPNSVYKIANQGLDLNSKDQNSAKVFPFQKPTTDSYTSMKFTKDEQICCCLDKNQQKDSEVNTDLQQTKDQTTLCEYGEKISRAINCNISNNISDKYCGKSKTNLDMNYYFDKKNNLECTNINSIEYDRVKKEKSELKSKELYKTGTDSSITSQFSSFSEETLEEDEISCKENDFTFSDEIENNTTEKNTETSGNIESQSYGSSLSLTSKINDSNNTYLKTKALEIDKTPSKLLSILQERIKNLSDQKPQTSSNSSLTKKRVLDFVKSNLLQSDKELKDKMGISFENVNKNLKNKLRKKGSNLLQNNRLKKRDSVSKHKLNCPYSSTEKRSIVCNVLSRSKSNVTRSKKNNYQNNKSTPKICAALKSVKQSNFFNIFGQKNSNKSNKPIFITPKTYQENMKKYGFEFPTKAENIRAAINNSCTENIDSKVNKFSTTKTCKKCLRIRHSSSLIFHDKTKIKDSKRSMSVENDRRHIYFQERVPTFFSYKYYDQVAPYDRGDLKLRSLSCEILNKNEKVGTEFSYHNFNIPDNFDIVRKHSLSMLESIVLKSSLNGRSEHHGSHDLESDISKFYEGVIDPDTENKIIDNVKKRAQEIFKNFIKNLDQGESDAERKDDYLNTKEDTTNIRTHFKHNKLVKSDDSFDERESLKGEMYKENDSQCSECDDIDCLQSQQIIFKENGEDKPKILPSDINGNTKINFDLNSFSTENITRNLVTSSNQIEQNNREQSNYFFDGKNMKKVKQNINLERFEVESLQNYLSDSEESNYGSHTKSESLDNSENIERCCLKEKKSMEALCNGRNIGKICENNTREIEFKSRVSKNHQSNNVVLKKEEDCNLKNSISNKSCDSLSSVDYKNSKNTINNGNYLNFNKLNRKDEKIELKKFTEKQTRVRNDYFSTKYCYNFTGECKSLSIKPKPCRNVNSFNGELLNGSSDSYSDLSETEAVNEPLKINKNDLELYFKATLKPETSETTSTKPPDIPLVIVSDYHYSDEDRFFESFTETSLSNYLESEKTQNDSTINNFKAYETSNVSSSSYDGSDETKITDDLVKITVDKPLNEKMFNQKQRCFSNENISYNVHCALTNMFINESNIFEKISCFDNERFINKNKEFMINDFKTSQGESYQELLQKEKSNDMSIVYQSPEDDLFSSVKVFYNGFDAICDDYLNEEILKHGFSEQTNTCDLVKKDENFKNNSNLKCFEKDEENTYSLDDIDYNFHSYQSSSNLVNATLPNALKITKTNNIDDIVQLMFEEKDSGIDSSKTKQNESCQSGCSNQHISRRFTETGKKDKCIRSYKFCKSVSSSRISKRKRKQKLRLTDVANNFQQRGQNNNFSLGVSKFCNKLGQVNRYFQSNNIIPCKNSFSTNFKKFQNLCFENSYLFCEKNNYLIPLANKNIFAYNVYILYGKEVSDKATQTKKDAEFVSCVCVGAEKKVKISQSNFKVPVKPLKSHAENEYRSILKCKEGERKPCSADKKTTEKEQARNAKFHTRPEIRRERFDDLECGTYPSGKSHQRPTSKTNNRKLIKSEKSDDNQQNKLPILSISFTSHSLKEEESEVINIQPKDFESMEKLCENNDFKQSNLSFCNIEKISPSSANEDSDFNHANDISEEDHEKELLSIEVDKEESHFSLIQLMENNDDKSSDVDSIESRSISITDKNEKSVSDEKHALESRSILINEKSESDEKHAHFDNENRSKSTSENEENMLIHLDKSSDHKKIEQKINLEELIENIKCRCSTKTNIETETASPSSVPIEKIHQDIPPKTKNISQKRRKKSVDIKKPGVDKTSDKQLLKVSPVLNQKQNKIDLVEDEENKSNENKSSSGELKTNEINLPKVSESVASEIDTAHQDVYFEDNKDKIKIESTPPSKTQTQVYNDNNNKKRSSLFDQIKTPIKSQEAEDIKQIDELKPTEISKDDNNANLSENAKQLHCLMSESEIMNLKKTDPHSLRSSLTDKEIFEKLLSNYEKESTMAQKLSKDEDFLRDQMQDVENDSPRESFASTPTETIKSMIEKPKKRTSSKTSIVFKEKSRTSLYDSSSGSNRFKRFFKKGRSDQKLKKIDMGYDGERERDTRNVMRRNDRKSLVLTDDDNQSIITVRNERKPLTEQEIQKFRELGDTFRRGFRPDSMTLSGKTCLQVSEEEQAARINSLSKKRNSVIEFSERDSPLDYLLNLGFSIDEASNAIKDEDVKHRLYAAITEARIWVNEINTNQGTLLYLAAYKTKPKLMRYFLQLIEAIINKRINDAVSLDAILKLLEKVEDRQIPLSKIFGFEQFEDEDSEEIHLRKQLRQLFVRIFKVADKEARLNNRTLDGNSIELLRILAAKYRAGLHPHLELIARYIGQNLLQNEVQLEAAMIYLSRLDTADVNLANFEQYCSVNCNRNTVSEE